MAQPEKESGLIGRLGRPQVRLGGFWAVLGAALGETSKKEGPQSYHGPLERFFKGDFLPQVKAEIVLGDKSFKCLMSYFVNKEPGKEFFRISFIQPTTYKRVILDLQPQKLEIKKIEEQDGQPPKEMTVFTWDIYAEGSLRGMRDRFLFTRTGFNLSIKKSEEVSDLTIFSALWELDLRRDEPADIDKLVRVKPVRIEPMFIAAQELGEVIGENLGVLPSEQPR